MDINDTIWEDGLVGKTIFKLHKNIDLRVVKSNNEALRISQGVLTTGALLTVAMPNHLNAPFPYKKSLIEIYLEVLKEQKSKSVEFRFESDTVVGWFRVFVIPVSRTMLYMSFVDISEIKEAVYTDSLTQIYNRRILEYEKDWFGAIFLDLDRFKIINDRRGHKLGDEVLIAVAYGLAAIAKLYKGWAIRAGGDEFILLFDNGDPFEVAALALEFIQSIKINGTEIGASLGVASGNINNFLECGNSERLLLAAEAASRQSKKNKISESPLDRITIWNDSLSKSQSQKTAIEYNLSREIESELFLVYQPIVDMLTGKIVGAEALIRWISPALGFVSPDKFIPIAEDNGMIYKISKWVMESAARQLQSWIKFDENFSVSVNIAPIEIEDPNFLPALLDLINLFGLKTKNLGIEITERGIANNLELYSKAISNLRNAFIQLKVDDFGTGTSGLEKLLTTKYDVVKVDKSLIPKSKLDVERISVCAAIVTLSVGLGFELIAEGVETEDQKDILMQMGYRFAQGYLFAKPLKPDEFESRYFADQKEA